MTDSEIKAAVAALVADFGNGTYKSGVSVLGAPSLDTGHVYTTLPLGVVREGLPPSDFTKVRLIEESQVPLSVTETILDYP